MLSFKRKRDEFEDSEDDEPSFGRQILPVADLPEDFHGEPEDGMQYLFTVRRDARNLPHTTWVENPYEPTPLPFKEDDRVMPEYISLPSEDWRTTYETRFKNFRKNVNQPTIGVPFAPCDGFQRPLPDKKERDFWWNFLAGKPESDWNPPKQPKTNTAMRRLSSLTQPDTTASSSVGQWQESWQTNDDGEVELVLRLNPSDPAPPEDVQNSPPVTMPIQEIIIYKPREPLPSLLRYIDEVQSLHNVQRSMIRTFIQRMALHLLMYFAHWINVHLQRPHASSQLLETHARWIFALLTKVDDYVSADDMNMLRTLARACIALLKELNQRHPCESSQSLDENKGYMNARSCWIIVSTIAGVWAQRDLWIDAEDILKSLGATGG
ncbi:hypothetical protein C0992_004446 [Termitomyces sp. T32_za158]|nr:hypothetical protein C0992_004446 [Termitomyces sp. T32_za158]